jgi:hypothetical protein
MSRAAVCAHGVAHQQTSTNKCALECNVLGVIYDKVHDKCVGAWPSTGLQACLKRSGHPGRATHIMP